MSKKQEKTVSELAALGGRAASASMTKDEKRARGQRAANGRWQKNAPQATHVGELDLAGRKIACAVLTDGRRVLNVRTFIQALGRKGNIKSSAIKEDGDFYKDPPFLTANNLKPFIDNYLPKTSFDPVVYRSTTGSSAYGYEANFLPVVCRIYLDARRANMLTVNQKNIAEACEILLAAFANVGIDALIDEATGFQYNRTRDALQKLLEQYVSHELARWEKTFDVDYYRHLYRLKKWKIDPKTTKRTHQVGRITADIIYDRIHPDLIEELKRVKIEAGKPNAKLHQGLTKGPTGGHPRLKQHLEGVISLMSVADTWEQFKDWIDRRYPKQWQTLKMYYPKSVGS